MSDGSNIPPIPVVGGFFFIILHWSPITDPTFRCPLFTTVFLLIPLYWSTFMFSSPYWSPLHWPAPFIEIPFIGHRFTDPTFTGPLLAIALFNGPPLPLSITGPLITGHPSVTRRLDPDTPSPTWMTPFLNLDSHCAT